MRLLAELSLPHLRTRAPVHISLVAVDEADEWSDALVAAPFRAYHLLRWPNGLLLPDGSTVHASACLRMDGYFEAADALAHLMAHAEPSALALLMLTPPAAPIDFARCVGVAWDVARAHYRADPERWSADCVGR